MCISSILYEEILDIHEKEIDMKKWIMSAVLCVAVIFACTGCSSSLFSDSSVVKFGDTYTHEDPKDLTYDERIVLQGENFGSRLESDANTNAYPDTMMYDENGNMIGMYDYDAATGLAKGWANIEDGTYTAFPEGQEVDLGMPDESKMISIPGTVTLGAVVYGNKEEAVAAYLYFFLSDASAKDLVKENVESLYGLTLTEESDTVLTCVQDKDYIADQFGMEEEEGYPADTKDAAAYADILKQMYGISEYTGENPYKPYAEHKDPENLEFDKRVVLTGSGEAAVDEEYVKDISSETDYLYGKDGKIVAQYTYYECPSKEAADELQEKYFTSAERVSDTVLELIVEGQNMTDTVNTFKGYNVLKDDSLDEYVRMIQETYFTSVYEQ